MGGNELSKYEKNKGVSVSFNQRHDFFLKEVLYSLNLGKEPFQAFKDIEAEDVFFNKKEQEKMSDFSPIEQLLNKELTIDTRHEIAWSGYVQNYGQLSAGRFFRRPNEINRPLGMGRLRFQTASFDEVIMSRNGVVGTREELAKRAQFDYLKAGPSLQSAGVVIGAPVYGVLRIMGRSHKNALGWANLACAAADIVTVGGRNFKFRPSRGSSSRPSWENNIRFTDIVKRGVVTFPKPRQKRSLNVAAPGQGFFVAPPANLKNPKPNFFKY